MAVDAAPLSRQEKVAIILMAIDEEAAKEIINFFPDEEIRVISQAMTKMGSVQKEQSAEILWEFLRDANAPLNIVGNYHNTEKFLQKVLEPEKFEHIVEGVRGQSSADNVWESLSNLPDQAIANFLKHEYPQTTAVILSKARVSKIAAVLNRFSKEYAFEVLKRLLLLEEVKPEALTNIEEVIKSELGSPQSQLRYRDGSKVVANIFDHLDHSISQNFMQMLERFDRELAAKVRSHILTFADLTRLDNLSMQKLLRHIDKSLLSLALKEADEKIRDAFVSALSQRAAKLMLEEMEYSEVQDDNLIIQAQQQILDVAKMMLDEGTIALAKGD